MGIADARTGVDPDPLSIPAAPIIEWHRIDVTRQLALSFTLGSIAMCGGMLAVAGLVVGRGLGSLAWGALGIALVFGGGASTIFGVMRVLWEERYLALRVDGVLFVDGPKHRLVSWDDVESVRHDAARDAVVFELEGGEEWALARKFAGTDNAALAKSAANVCRKARFGMYDGAR